ncbi:MAG: DNA polymerase III subunit delta' [Rhizobiaceae bacterium]
MDDYDVYQSHDQLDGYASPAQAAEVFGHESQADFLASAYRSGKMHHAFLFDGPTGIGKASLAFIFARHIVSNPDFTAAPATLDGMATASLTRQIAMAAHPQVLHLTRPMDQKTGKHKTQLTVDETRRIGHFLSHTVAGNGYRVVIVDPVNDMNANAANALLKNLEEPTPRTLFILIAQSSGRLLPTIRSRCLSLRFQSLDDESMHLATDAMGLRQRLSEGEVAEIVSRSNGSPRVAAMLCDGGGLEIIQTAEKLLQAEGFDASVAMKLGEAVSTREAEPVFHLLCDHLVGRLAQDAARATLNDISLGNRLSKLHTELTDSIRQSTQFNLDKRQVILNVMQRCHALQGRR